MPGDAEQHWAVDGIDEGVARIEVDGERILSVPRWILPDSVTVGQLLAVTRSVGTSPGSVVLTIAIDDRATARARQSSAAATARVAQESRAHDPGGDVTL